MSPVGPFNQWPTGSGFEYFYGFIGGEANQYYPGCTTAPRRSSRQVARRGLHADRGSGRPGHHLGAPAEGAGARQAVLHVLGARRHPRAAPRAQQWSDKYKGKFDDGWERCASDPRPPEGTRRGTRGCGADQRHDEIPAWDDMPAELKPVLARQMENYAGFLEQTDHEVGRLIDAIDDMGVLDDTLIYYIIGDNGASAEGTINGSFNEMHAQRHAGIETAEFLPPKIEISAPQRL